MKPRKLIGLLALTVLLSGAALTVQGCFEERYTPAYGYGSYYPYGPAYSSPPVVYGDWDERHVWHDRDWWTTNRRPWVEEHHHEWLARPVPHEMYGSHERHEHD